MRAVTARGTGATGLVESETLLGALAPMRRELLIFCYRMLGSVDEAEDVVQDTYLRAWRSVAEFEGRSSLRSWLYRIATNACLTALERRGRRGLPSGLGEPERFAGAALGAAPRDVAWLQPLPDGLLTSGSADPAEVVAARGSVRLALIAALQYLPARQRAVLILRDVLAWRAAEVADLLDTSTAAVKSTLQRARAQLAAISPAPDRLAEPADPRLRALLDRYMAAFENADVVALTELLRADAVLEMPPLAVWFAGRDTVARFFATRVMRDPGGLRMVPTSANGQPAVAAYLRDAEGIHRAHGVHVLTAGPARISRIVAFLDPRLFRRFGLPSVLTRPSVHGRFAGSDSFSAAGWSECRP